MKTRVDFNDMPSIVIVVATEATKEAEKMSAGRSMGLKDLVEQETRRIEKELITRALAMVAGDVIKAARTLKMSHALLQGKMEKYDISSDEGETRPAKNLPEALDAIEEQIIRHAYAQAKSVKTETARLLGINTSALYYKLEKYGIK